MDVNKVLNTCVSYQQNLSASTEDATLASVLDEIKQEKYFESINYLRTLYSSGDIASYTAKKKNLPGITFCASFNSNRRKESLKQYNSLIVLDIDKTGANELLSIKKCLEGDRYVFCFWESPSGDGIKGLIHLKFKYGLLADSIDYSHKAAFNQLVEYFITKYNIELDTSGSDITRLCFVSSDKMLVLKDDIASFEVNNSITEIASSKKTQKNQNGKTVADHKIKNILYNPSGKNSNHHRYMMKNIIKFLTKNSISITSLYEDWLHIAFAISNSFTYDVGLGYFIDLSKLDKDKFDERECKRFLLGCYRSSWGKIGFNTIVHLASDQGFQCKYLNAEST
ncbi:MAG: hypothetical protein HOD85_09590 [Deltaproteobacteria bacterium]|nr:hypothetical protein [Deltaproteobacteria bacterium]